MKKTPLALLAALLPLVACNTAPQPAPSSPAIAPHNTEPRIETRASGPQNFDFYLLNLSWSPEFCATHASAPECAQHPTFVLHGLWPQNNSGPFPEHCSTAPGPSNPSQFSDIYPDPGLLQHEWQTHGTCSGLSPEAFFSAARTAFRSIRIPPTLGQLQQQTSMPPAQILGLFTDANPGLPSSSLALSCGNNFLTAIEVCLDKQLHPIACPAIRSCRANTVRIPPP